MKALSLVTMMAFFLSASIFANKNNENYAYKVHVKILEVKIGNDGDWLQNGELDIDLQRTGYKPNLTGLYFNDQMYFFANSGELLKSTEYENPGAGNRIRDISSKEDFLKARFDLIVNERDGSCGMIGGCVPSYETFGFPLVKKGIDIGLSTFLHSNKMSYTKIITETFPKQKNSVYLKLKITKLPFDNIWYDR